MATAGPVRPTQALRNRRESQRPSHLRTNTKNANEDGGENGRHRKERRKPLVMTDEYILHKFQGHPPSLIIHLHQHHFRFEHQDGNFPYSSPMRPFLQHVREGTIPHFMLEEMFRASVPFYEGCLIVQIVDHRSTDAKTQTGPSTATGGNKVAPFSVHAYNSFITPSPFVAYPSPPKQGDSPSSKSATQKAGVEASENKENAPVQSQTGMSTQKSASKTPKVATKVLFPTAISLQTEIELLANLPMPDTSAIRKQQSRSAATPGAQPPTPLTSVPPTPSSSSRPAKRQKMVLDETNIHEFEAHVINLTAPALYLDPAHSMLESQDIIEATSHPLNKNAPPAPKTRKRTTAELAADEAASAAEQSFMLFGDSQPGASAGQVSNEGETMRNGAPFEPRFSRFKTLENIKIAHEENERVKKEEEARQAQAKRQQQADAEEARRRDAATVEHSRIMMQRQQQQAQAQAQQAAEQRKRAQVAQAAQAAQAQQAAAAQAQNNMMPNPQHAQFQQTSQPAQGSPMLRQQTPMQGSPVMNGNPVVNHAMGGVPMAPTTSSQAGSPPRPGSAVPHAAMPMARQMSRQQSSQHPGSAHGTPQMIQGTPQMGQAVPVTRHMTPQPSRMNPHGSPVAGMQGTPMMMQNSQMHPSGMTHQQFMQLQYQRQAQARQQAAGFQGSPGQGMSPEQLNALRSQQQAHQHAHAQAQAQAHLAQQNHASGAGTPNPQFTAQMARNQMSSSGSPVPGQQRPGTGHAPNGIPPGMSQAQFQHLRSRQTQQAMLGRIQRHYNGNVPEQIQAMIRQGGVIAVYNMMTSTSMHRNTMMAQQRSQQGVQGQMPNQMQPQGMGGGMAGMGGGAGGANMLPNGMTVQQMQQLQQMQQNAQQNGQQGDNSQYLAAMMQERQRLAMQSQVQRQNMGMQGMNMGGMGMGGWPQGMGRGQGGMG